MICFAKEFWSRHKPRIRLREPGKTVIITGADREKINATYDGGNRLVQLIVHTKIRSLGRKTRRF